MQNQNSVYGVLLCVHSVQLFPHLVGNVSSFRDVPTLKHHFRWQNLREDAISLNTE